ncbi:MAG: MgtC/SapB family protein [Clostridia bacterium]|nr:MgtC/SapB family protein [Clostridia bacterium]
MKAILDLMSEINLVSVAVRLVLAVILGGLIGSERGKHGRAAGLRTHILICIGATMTALTGLFVTGSVGGDAFRISAQVVSGIGFLGAGTILVKNNSVVTGLTTAAGMWTTAAIGIAIGYGFYTASIIATFLCIFTATVLSKLEANSKNVLRFYAEVKNVNETGAVVERIKELSGIVCSVDVMAPKSNVSGHVGLNIDVKNPDEKDDVKSMISSVEGVCFVVEDNA